MKRLLLALFMLTLAFSAISAMGEGELAALRFEVGGSLLLDDANADANLAVRVPEVAGAEGYVVRTYERESGWRDAAIVYAAGVVGIKVESDDNVHPIHLTVTVTAQDGDQEPIARGTKNVVVYPLSGVLRLPGQAQTIDGEAFASTAAWCAIVPDGCTTVGAQAFAGIPNLCSVSIPASVTEIADDAFSGCSSDLVIYAPAGSAAAGLAQRAGLTLFEMN